MPITACPCALTAIEGTQYEAAPAEASKIVPERDSAGVVPRFVSSYQRTPSREGGGVAAPLASTLTFWAAYSLPPTIETADSLSSIASIGFELPATVTFVGNCVDGTLT